MHDLGKARGTKHITAGVMLDFWKSQGVQEGSQHVSIKAEHLIILTIDLYTGQHSRVMTRNISMLLNFGVGEDLWEYLGQKRNKCQIRHDLSLKAQTTKLKLSFILGIFSEEPIHWKRPLCLEQLKINEGADQQPKDGYNNQWRHDPTIQKPKEQTGYSGEILCIWSPGVLTTLITIMENILYRFIFVNKMCEEPFQRL